MNPQLTAQMAAEQELMQEIALQCLQDVRDIVRPQPDVTPPNLVEQLETALGWWDLLNQDEPDFGMYCLFFFRL